MEIKRYFLAPARTTKIRIQSRVRLSKRQEVSVLNLHKGYRINSRLVKIIVSYILSKQDMRSRASLEIVFLSDAQIRPLNKKYKGEDRPTDVLSFDLGDTNDIFISIDKARENSKIFGTTFQEELTLYVIHGILHLSGYDDETKKDRAGMEKRQKEILSDLCKREDLSKVLTPR